MLLQTAGVRKQFIIDDVYQGEVCIQKVDADKNMSDPLTKLALGWELQRYVDYLGEHLRTGRHEMDGVAKDDSETHWEEAEEEAGFKGCTAIWICVCGRAG